MSATRNYPGFPDNSRFSPNANLALHTHIGCASGSHLPLMAKSILTPRSSTLSVVQLSLDQFMDDPQNAHVEGDLSSGSDQAPCGTHPRPVTTGTNLGGAA